MSSVVEGGTETARGPGTLDLYRDALTPRAVARVGHRPSASAGRQLFDLLPFCFRVLGQVAVGCHERRGKRVTHRRRCLAALGSDSATAARAGPLTTGWRSPQPSSSAPSRCCRCWSPSSQQTDRPTSATPSRDGCSRTTPARQRAPSCRTRSWRPTSRCARPSKRGRRRRR